MVHSTTLTCAMYLRWTAREGMTRAQFVSQLAGRFGNKLVMVNVMLIRHVSSPLNCEHGCSIVIDLS